MSGKERAHHTKNSSANVKRAKFYEVYAANKHDHNAMTTIDKTLHGKKRRVLNGVFSTPMLQAAENFVARHVDRWCDLLIDESGEDWSNTKDMAHWSDNVVLDIFGDLCFGRSFETKEAGENPLKKVPELMANFMTFIYPVSIAQSHCLQRSSLTLTRSQTPPLSIFGCGSSLGASMSY